MRARFAAGKGAAVTKYAAVKKRIEGFQDFGSQEAILVFKQLLPSKLYIFTVIEDSLIESRVLGRPSTIRFQLLLFSIPFGKFNVHIGVFD